MLDNSAVALGRIFGWLVVVGAVALGVKVAGDAGQNQSEFWLVVNVSITPAAIGFLTIVAAEIANQLGTRRA